MKSTSKPCEAEAILRAAHERAERAEMPAEDRKPGEPSSSGQQQVPISNQYSLVAQGSDVCMRTLGKGSRLEENNTRFSGSSYAWSFLGELFCE